MGTNNRATLKYTPGAELPWECELYRNGARVRSSASVLMEKAVTFVRTGHFVDHYWHTCHFCGTDVNFDGYEDTANTRRHWLSDCRPDLVKHEVGPSCTWPVTGDPMLDKELNRPWCYAYQDHETHEWGDEHIHFHQDGPM